MNFTLHNMNSTYIGCLYASISTDIMKYDYLIGRFNAGPFDTTSGRLAPLQTNVNRAGVSRASVSRASVNRASVNRASINRASVSRASINRYTSVCVLCQTEIFCLIFI